MKKLIFCAAAICLVAASPATADAATFRGAYVDVSAHRDDLARRAVDFTICNRRVFSKPTQDAHGFDNDYGVVRWHGNGHSPDPGRFEEGAPRRSGHCVTVLLRVPKGQRTARITGRIHWPRSGDGAEFHDSFTLGGPQV
jgi:hypothetical protein